MSVNVQVVKFLRFWGIDRAISYTLIGRGWSVLSGPVTLLIIAARLSPEEQGFYYTFASILGLQIFFELGLTYVILQFASHEKARLEWTTRRTLAGDAHAKARLSSLLRRALAWYGVLAALVVIILLPAGLGFFDLYEPAGSGAAVVWRLPWVWVVLVSAGSLFVSPIYAVLEGCGLVAEVAFMRVWQGALGSVLLWSALSLHWGLLATPVAATSGFLVGGVWLWLRYRAFIFDLLSVIPNEATISWRNEIWPFQWKIALSWLSGYFIHQLFNPVLFAFYGAAAAGQMGMSMNIMQTIGITALAWVHTKSAPFGNLVAKKEFKQLDRMFFPCLWQSFLVVALGGLCFWLAAFELRSIQHPLGQRLLPPLPLGLLFITAACNHIWFAEGMYLRAHKQEPFLAISVIGACLTGVSTYFLGKRFGATGMMTGYFLITLFVGLGMGTWIFLRKRRLWHAEA
jgi:hypothetical protein